MNIGTIASYLAKEIETNTETEEIKIIHYQKKLGGFILFIPYGTAMSDIGFLKIVLGDLCYFFHVKYSMVSKSSSWCQEYGDQIN